MIKSMTGFGRNKYENDNREYVVEIKSVNNRYSDINIKMPRNISYLEDKVKKEVISTISRGKIDVFISFDNNSDKGKNIKLNTELAKKYVEELNKLAEDVCIKNNISVMEISKFPDVLNIKIEDDAEELIWNELNDCLQGAIKNFITMREIEGQRIKQDLESRIEIIKQSLSKIDNTSDGLVGEYIVKLEKRIKELLKTDIIDQTRLAQEVVIYSDKCSVQEELTRLNSHISQFLNMINAEGPIGKKIDFLIQEMNRETNTIGSKANNLEITDLVVEIKTEIENIREQIQNIE